MGEGERIELPPQSLAAEKATIGSCLVSKAAAQKARLHLKCQDFYSGPHKLIFRAIEVLLDEEPDGVIDPILVSEELRRRGKLEEAGGLEYLVRELPGTISTADHVEHYAKIVRNVSLERQVDTQLIKVRQEKTPERLHDLGDLIFQMQGMSSNRILSFQDGIEEAVKELLENPPPLVHTGFPYLDLLLGGLEPGDLMTVGARTSGGKTAWKMRAACNMAMAGEETLFLTTEMKTIQMLLRVLPMATKIKASKFRSRKLTDTDRDHIMEVARDILSQLPLHIMGKSRLSLRDIRSACVRVKPSVVFIDYLQRVKLPKAENRVYAIEEFMVELKTFLQDTGIIGILGAQLDRAMDRNPDAPPVLADLRGSGAIEHESDQVGLMWMPSQKYIKKASNWVNPSPGSTAMEFIIAKNRHGARNIAVDLELNRDLVKVAERSLAYKDPDEGE